MEMKIPGVNVNTRSKFRDRQETNVKAWSKCKDLKANEMSRSK